jgi:membrane associated rhomboid family serine protease
MSLSILILILVSTSVISLVAFGNRGMLESWIYIPYEVKHQNAFGRIFKHLFVHADIMHLSFNMLSLYFLGEFLEYQLVDAYGLGRGELHFLTLYFGGGFFATLVPYVRNQNNPTYRSLGASGAVSSVIFATILWNPTMQLSIMFLPIAIPAYIFGPLYLMFEFWADRRGGTGIAHDAHLGGALYGIIYTLIINPDTGKYFFSLIFG